MLVYVNSNFFVYYLKKKKVLITLWRNTYFSTSHFQKQMMFWLRLSQQYPCTACLFNQCNFTWQIPSEIYNWMENEINRKLYAKGINQLYFVCADKSKEKANLKDMFNQIDSVFLPRYYNSLHDALQWISSGRSKRKQIEACYVEQVYNIQTVQKIRNPQKDVITKLFSLPVDEIQMIRSSLMQNQLNFIQQNYQKFLLLNVSERTVLRLILCAYSNKQIAEKLFISPKTVKTHRRNISRKLKSKHWTELSKYDVFYRIG